MAYFASERSPIAHIDLDATATLLAEQARRAGRGAPVVAVAHSMGGAVLSRAAEQHPRLFRHLGYVTAYMPAAEAQRHRRPRRPWRSTGGPRRRCPGTGRGRPRAAAGRSRRDGRGRCVRPSPSRSYLTPRRTAIRAARRSESRFELLVSVNQPGAVVLVRRCQGRRLVVMGVRADGT
ncbi:alpha/beta fold hydrolase [Streptomyces sp. NPDC004284]|uniref:alpha/beta fold hydrolase n=1 Tax=Streptomyces sp. NPDC004284 TaxID=3364695 RepID=UPI0036738F74